MRQGKRIVSVLLAMLTLALAVLTAACQKPGDGTETAAPETSAETSAESSAETGEKTEINGLYGWFDYGTALYLRDSFSVGIATEGISFQMAKNEKEGFQYILTASEDYTDLRCEVTDLSDGAGHTLPGEVNVVWYLWVQKADAIHERGFTPYMMLPQDDPYQGGTFDVEAGTARTLFVRYETDKDTVPGTYTGTLTVKQGSEALLSGEVSVRVRDIYYEEKTECLTMFGLGYDPFDANEVIRPADGAPMILGGNELEKIYADYMLDNRLNPGTIPYPDGLLSEGALDYVNNPRVTMLMMNNNDTLGQQYAIAKENGLLDKFNVGTFDEPHEQAHLASILQMGKTLNRVYPGLRGMDALNTDLPWEGRNIIERLSDVTTMYCPVVLIFNGEIRESVRKWQAERGDTVFWYVCGSGSLDTINLLPCMPGTDKRVLFWQQYQQNVDGFLYWRVTFWNESVYSNYNVDVWSDDYLTAKRKYPKTEEGPTDDGVLLYWHPTTGLPVSTLGFEAVRDGIEDFQLMKMAERVVGRDEVVKIVEEITTDPTVFIHYEDGSTPILEALKNRLFDITENGQ